MNGRIAILTPDPGSEYFESRWPDVFEASARPLREAGLSVHRHVWTEPLPAADYAAVLPLLAWGYPHTYDRWLAAVRGWADASAPLHNPASVLIWNSDKRYLGRLAEAGVPVVPTVYADRLEVEQLEQAAERFGTGRLVAKPQVSAGAWQTIRWSRASRSPEGRRARR